MPRTKKGPALFDKKQLTSLQKQARSATQTGKLATLDKLLKATYTTISKEKIDVLYHVTNNHISDLTINPSQEATFHDKYQDKPYLTADFLTELLMRAAKLQQVEIVKMLLTHHDDLKLATYYSHNALPTQYQQAMRIPIKIDLSTLKEHLSLLPATTTKSKKSRTKTINKKAKNRDAITMLILQACFDYYYMKADVNTLIKLMKKQYKRYFTDQTQADTLKKYYQQKVITAGNLRWFTQMNGIFKNSDFALTFFKKQIDEHLAHEHKHTWDYIEHLIAEAHYYFGSHKDSQFLIFIGYVKQQLIKKANHHTFIDSTTTLDYTNHLFASQMLEYMQQNKDNIVDQAAKMEFFTGCLTSGREAELINDECQALTDEMHSLLTQLQIPNNHLKTNNQSSHQTCTQLLKTLLNAYSICIDNDDIISSRTIMEFLRNKKTRFDKVFLTLQEQPINGSLTSLTLQPKNKILVETMLRKHRKNLSPHRENVTYIQ